MTNDHAHYDIRDFGALGDGNTLDTKAVQSAIDRAAENGGGTVRVPAGCFLVGTLRLASRVHLHLCAGARLLGSPDPAQYRREIGDLEAGLPSAQLNLGKNIYLGYAFIYAVDCEQVAITGLGTIDGNDVKDPKGEEGFRGPHCILLENCREVTIRDIRIERSANWALLPLNCENVRIDGVSIRGGHDGIDPDSSRNVVITNCNIQSGDDGICLKTDFGPLENVLVSNCLINTACSGIKFGTKSNGDFRNVLIANCTIQGPGKYPHRNSGNLDTISGISIETVDGGTIEGVRIENILMDRVDTALFACIGTRLGRGAMRGISIRGISARRILHPILLTGSPGLPIEDLRISDCDFQLRAAPAPSEVVEQVIELGDRYPEANIFGVLPTAGIYARHLRQSRIERIRIRPAQGEHRPASFLEACDQVRVEDVDLG